MEEQNNRQTKKLEKIVDESSPKDTEIDPTDIRIWLNPFKYNSYVHSVLKEARKDAQLAKDKKEMFSLYIAEGAFFTLKYFPYATIIYEIALRYFQIND